MVDRRPKGKAIPDGAKPGAAERDISANTMRSPESAPNDSRDPTQNLAALIEAERTELMYVHSILRTL